MSIKTGMLQNYIGTLQKNIENEIYQDFKTQLVSEDC